MHWIECKVARLWPFHGNVHVGNQSPAHQIAYDLDVVAVAD